jgi:hypothetical protein
MVRCMGKYQDIFHLIELMLKGFVDGNFGCVHLV